jgi:hypothetical protein
LREARARRDDARKVLNGGVDPIEARDRKRVDAAHRKTFGECATEYIAAHLASWRSLKHHEQWRMTLEVYCKPIWSRPVDEIDTAAVLECLTPIWQAKTETASRLRGRIELILDAAKAQALRAGENPARWRGHLSALLPRRGKHTRSHFAAMDYREVPAFLAELRLREGIAARALEFVILTAARSGEVLGATWQEFDLDNRLWIIPATRMKAGPMARVRELSPAKGLFLALVTCDNGHYHMLPECKMTWRVYAIIPIDYGWDFLPTIAEVAGQLGKSEAENKMDGIGNSCSLAGFLQDFDTAREKAKHAGWEGDYRTGHEPRVFWLPMETEFRYAFVWKQENNGTTFVVSPCALPWLDELT